MQSYINQQILEELKKARKIVFISDERIDGDSLGASLALADFMKQKEVEVPVFVSAPVPDKYSRIPLINQCTYNKDIFNDPEIDLIVAFDCSDEEYIKDILSLIPANPKVINIDHHATNPHYGDINQVIVEAPATAVVVHSFFKDNKIIPSREAATLMLLGICFDTGIFQNASTNSNAFKISSELILLGAQVKEVISVIFSNRSVHALRLWGKALERLQEFNGPFVSTYLTLEDIESCGVTEEEADGLSNFISLVIDHPTLIWFREKQGGSVKASMRSDTKDVAVIAQAFGGGGHSKSAGFTVKNTKIIESGNKWEFENHPNLYNQIQQILESQKI